jgi:hypothetical protein
LTPEEAEAAKKRRDTKRSKLKGNYERLRAEAPRDGEE